MLTRIYAVKTITGQNEHLIRFAFVTSGRSKTRRYIQENLSNIEVLIETLRTS